MSITATSEREEKEMLRLYVSAISGRGRAGLTSRCSIGAGDSNDVRQNSDGQRHPDVHPALLFLNIFLARGRSKFLGEIYFV